MTVARIAGIAGGLAPSRISQMLGAMASGGPHAVGAQGGTGIGSTDRANGWYDDGRLAVAFDGLIYNPDDIADGPLGGDAALIAHSFRRFGFPAALERLNGDFALALHDREAGRLYLARDRFGVKPLYYSERGARFAFASRPAGLLALPGIRSEPRSDYLAKFAAGHYRFFDNPPELSPYADVLQLRPGRLLCRGDRATTVTVWYDPAESGDSDDDGEALAEAYAALFRDAVARRLKRVGRAAFTLSGGLDSSSVVTTAAQLTDREQHAFSTVYGGGAYDESTEIRDVLAPGGIVWHPVEIGEPDLIGHVARLTPRHDQPLSTVTWLTHALLCEEVRAAGFDALFGGLGGDEQHAGEYDYFFYFFADLLAAGETARHAREVAAWKRHHDHTVWRKSAAVADRKRRTLTDPAIPGRVRPDAVLLRRYAEALSPDLASDLPEPAPLDSRFCSYLKSHTYNEIYRETMPCCLRASDRNAAAVGLVDVFPFFDHRLVDFAFRVPSTLKIRDGVTKQLLRRAMRGILPEATRSRITKTGWNAPLDRWFATHLREPLMDLVRSARFRSRGIYSPEAVERLIEEHAEIVLSGAPRENHMMFLWQLISLEIWLQNIDAHAAMLRRDQREPHEAAAKAAAKG
jgi:asparagine synthase (glutamine-hydrolysing)